MKKLLSLLVMVPFLVQAQTGALVSNSVAPGTKTIPILSHTNYGGTVGDTTGYFSVRDFSEVAILAKATDTIDYVCAVDYMNSVTGGIYTNQPLGTYTDSVNIQAGVTGKDTVNVKAFYLRGAGGDRIVGGDLIRLRLTPSTAATTKNGIRSGRKYIFYLFVSKQSKAF